MKEEEESNTYELTYERNYIVEETTGITFKINTYTEEDLLDGETYLVAEISEIRDENWKKISENQLPEDLLDFVEDHLSEYAGWVEEDEQYMRYVEPQIEREWEERHGLG